MKIKYLFSILAFCLLGSVVEAKDNRSVAIAPVSFLEEYKDSIAVGLDRGFSSEGFKVVSVKKTAKTMTKNGISQEDLSDEKNLLRLGQLTKTDYIVYAFGTKDVLTIALMNVGTGEYEWMDNYPVVTSCLRAAAQNIVHRQLNPGAKPLKNIGLYPETGEPEVQDGLAGYWHFDWGGKFAEQDNSDYGNTSWLMYGKLTTRTITGYGLAYSNGLLCVKEHLCDAVQWTLCQWIYIPKTMIVDIVLLKEKHTEHKQDYYGMHDNVEYYGYGVTLLRKGSIETRMGGRCYRTDLTKWQCDENASVVNEQKLQVEITPGWHHFVITKTASKKEYPFFVYYVDGARVAEQTFDSRRSYPGSLYIGQYADAFDNVRFYERVLSEEEIMKIYRSEQQ